MTLPAGKLASFTFCSDALTVPPLLSMTSALNMPIPHRHYSIGRMLRYSHALRAWRNPIFAKLPVRGAAVSAAKDRSAHLDHLGRREPRGFCAKRGLSHDERIDDECLDEEQPMIEFKLEGRRALVTGSASGIGLAAAGRLARSGARVAMNDLPGDALGRAVAELQSAGCAVEAVPGDLGEPASARQVAARALERLGGLDY